MLVDELADGAHRESGDGIVKDVDAIAIFSEEPKQAALEKMFCSRGSS